MLGYTRVILSWCKKSDIGGLVLSEHNEGCAQKINILVRGGGGEVMIRGRV
jgi:hypothetical protein